MKLIVKDIIEETQDTLSICFKNGSIFNKLSYHPGQFLTLKVDINGQMHKRAYSFSSSPTEDKDLKITIKKIENGLVSNYLHENLRIGQKVSVDKPTGSFFVKPKKDAKKQYVFFAGGSGITPIFSIIKSLLAKEQKSKILLVYANQTNDSIIFLRTLETMAEKYDASFFVEHVIATNNKTADNYHSGLISDELLSKIFAKHQLCFSHHIYMICGPLGYIEKTKELLRSKGVNPKKIKVEVFKSPKVTTIDKDLVSNVTVTYNGQSYRLEVPGNKSILQAAIGNNIMLPYTCRAGMCISCKALCVSGEVKMTEGHFLEQEELDAGMVLTCISYPITENIELAY